RPVRDRLLGARRSSRPAKSAVGHTTIITNARSGNGSRDDQRREAACRLPHGEGRASCRSGLAIAARRTPTAGEPRTGETPHIRYRRHRRDFQHVAPTLPSACFAPHEPPPTGAVHRTWLASATGLCSAHEPGRPRLPTGPEKQANRDL